MTQLQDKIVAVTGGGTGIGAGIAAALAGAGCRVTIGGRRLDKLQQAAAAMTGPHEVRCHAIDVADATSIEAFFDDVNSQVGEIDILVNSAGINIQNRTMTTARST